MRILWLDEDPVQSARYHCDQHVSKMVYGYSQILSQAAYEADFYDPDHMYDYVNEIDDRLAEWAAESSDNYIRLLKMARALADEYEARYGGSHKCYDECLSKMDISNINIRKSGWTEPPIFVPDEHIEGDDYVQAYRNYYNYGARWTMTWFNRDVPEWYLGEVSEHHD